MLKYVFALFLITGSLRLRKCCMNSRLKNKVVWLLFLSLCCTMSQLGPFEVGQIKAHLHHGLTGAAILGILKKPDGKTGWSHQTIYSAID